MKARSGERGSGGRRRWVVVGGAVAALAVAAALFFFLQQEDEPQSTPGTVAEALAEGPLRLLYADFTEDPRLLAHDVRTGEVSEVGEPPRAGTTVAAPGSPWISISYWADGPRAVLWDPSTDRTTDIPRPAMDLFWKPTGDLLVFAEPLDIAECTPDECPSDTRVVVFDPETAEETVFQEGGPWTPLGWAGDRVLVADDDDPDVTLSVSAEDDALLLDLEPRSIWGASPDGRSLVTNESGETWLIELQPEGRLGEARAIQLGEGEELGAGRWAHDSSRFAAAAVSGRSTRLVVIDREGLDPLVLEGVDQEPSRMFWDPLGRGIAVSLVTDRFETSYCVVDVSEPCVPLFDWTSGLLPLRLEGS